MGDEAEFRGTFDRPAFGPYKYRGGDASPVSATAGAAGSKEADMSVGESIIARAKQALDLEGFRERNWTGTFPQYLDLVRRNPRITRSAFERIYDMLLSKGTREYVDHKKKILHYDFFDDAENDGQDAIYGLDIPLMRLVNIFKSAAQRYGTERRVILLHGPVGSSKSTIARLLKKGLEEYSRRPEGALYTFGWIRTLDKPDDVVPCPMHEEPLHLVPNELRPMFLDQLNEGRGPDDDRVRIEGDLCPFCRQEYRELSSRYSGDWTRVLNHVQVRRLILSEQDRMGIGTFQPKDEKNQDSTELTGDINYRKIAEYGIGLAIRARSTSTASSTSPTAGMIEFIEVLKLDVAFLYDLLGASQEHKIKPKKFAADRHRRGDHRPHERARVPAAPEQRVHGGPAGPDGEDRHPVHHQAERGDQDLREGLQRRQDPRASTSPRTPSRWRRCGPC